MKKLLTSLLSLLLIASLLLPSSALAECGCGECAECLCRPPVAETSVLIASSQSVSVVGSYTGVSFWALSEIQHVIGLKAPDEQVPVLPIQAVGKSFIRGCVETGLIREKGTMQALYNGAVYGFTQLEVAVHIKQEYVSLVETVVHERIGADAAVTANSIIASTNWWRNDTVSHIFFTTASVKIAVGTVTVNSGMDTIVLYAGDFNGDGTLELGFSAGWTVKEPEPEPDPAPERQPDTPCNPAPSCQKKSCSKKCQVNIQINLFSIVKNCFQNCFNLCK